jgi:hypothetical protein
LIVCQKAHLFSGIGLSFYIYIFNMARQGAQFFITDRPNNSKTNYFLRLARTKLPNPNIIIVAGSGT